MKGQILAINSEKQAAAIAFGQGQRALFRLSDWVDLLPPEVGMQVEFELDPDQKRARQVQMNAEMLVTGNSPHPTQATSFAMAPKRKSTLTLVTLFLGSLGGHRFYMGAWGWGLVQLLGIPLLLGLVAALVPALGILLYLAYAVFVLVELIRYILLTDAEFDDKLRVHQSQRPGAFSFFW